MSGNIIEVENLSKLYKLGSISTGTVSHDLNRWWHKLRKKEDLYSMKIDKNDRTIKTDSKYVWSLKDINFEIKQGDVFGIIGKNGAGKSTLLKILSKVTKPTVGEIRIGGSIASLLEVGTGFHPELSGRENIFLNGAILGMKKAEIKEKFDEIVHFSGIEKYIDTPVKRYSSGMYVRLAFAVSAHLEPEILIVDEVLSVGDWEFQQKCLGKMKDISQKQGRTILFVSHNISAVKQLCNKGMLLECGLQKATGEIADVLSVYQEDQLDVANGKRNGIPNGLPVYFVSWELEGTKDKHTCFTGDKVNFCFGVVCNTVMRNCEVRFAIKYQDMLIVHSSSIVKDAAATFTLSPGFHKLKFQFDFPVRDAKFDIEVNLLSFNNIVDSWTSSTKLTVLDVYHSNLNAGVINPDTKFSMEQFTIQEAGVSYQ